jgi:hypothetical protein
MTSLFPLNISFLASSLERHRRKERSNDHQLLCEDGQRQAHDPFHVQHRGYVALPKGDSPSRIQ